MSINVLPARTVASTPFHWTREHGMYRIEVWKCRSAWLELSYARRQAALAKLRRSIEQYSPLELGEEAGPFLIPRPGTCLLVWTSRIDQPDEVAPAGATLLDYFEPLVYMSMAKDLTAKQVADRLTREAG